MSCVPHALHPIPSRQAAGQFLSQFLLLQVSLLARPLSCCEILQKQQVGKLSSAGDGPSPTQEATCSCHLTLHGLCSTLKYKFLLREPPTYI